jgi:flavin-dependent dehydrogenase
MTYDAVVVGARCAGAPTALLLARRGYRVLLVDRASFPSDTLSSHFIKTPGIAKLFEWGLLDAVAATGAPPVCRFRLDYGEVVLSGSPTPMQGIRASYAPRRLVLDDVLVRAASVAGAEVREAFNVDELVVADGRVTGIRARGRTGTAIEERARIVVGADGRNSLVARAVNAPTYRARPALTCAYYTYWSDVSLDAFEGYYPPHRAILNFPTDANLVCSIVEWPQVEFGRVRSDVETEFWRALALSPGLFERLRSARRVAPIRGTGDLPNFFRTPFGPGWALVGDAGFHKDPLPAQGISDAFRDAELLADAISAGLAGRREMEDTLADYQRQRDEASSAMYELTCQRATLERPAHAMTALLRALQGNQTDTDRFIGMVIGTVPIPEFFAPENVQRIISTPAPV